MKKETEIRCRSCHQVRFKVPSMQKFAQCPQCGQKWRLRWFDPETATIMAPISWVEYEKKVL
ncbi:MAG: hypothetical protein ACE5IA_07990 [Dehalococcoidia bacterium]